MIVSNLFRAALIPFVLTFAFSSPAGAGCCDGGSDSSSGGSGYYSGGSQAYGGFDQQRWNGSSNYNSIQSVATGNVNNSTSYTYGSQPAKQIFPATRSGQAETRAGKPAVALKTAHGDLPSTENLKPFVGPSPTSANSVGLTRLLGLSNRPQASIRVLGPSLW